MRLNYNVRLFPQEFPLTGETRLIPREMPVSIVSTFQGGKGKSFVQRAKIKVEYCGAFYYGWVDFDAITQTED